MLPGKTYTFDDYFHILWRRKWLVIVPLLLVGSTTAVVTWRLPNQYRSTAVIEVTPQRVPSDYVQATVTSSPTERLASLREQVMSRTRLEQIILEFNLYPDLRRAGIMEDVIERMRRDITLDIPAGRGARSESSSFTISYVGGNAQVVTRVTERLTSVVIDENLKDRARLAEGTDEFLETQLQDARTRLVEQEKRLEAYRRQHAGELPSQLQSNLQVLQNAQVQMQSVLQLMAQDRDRKYLLERQLSDASVLEPIVAPPAPQGSNVPVTASAAEQLDAARARLTQLELKFTPGHPDVLKLRRDVAQLESRAEREALEKPIGTSVAAAAPSVTPAEAARLARIRDMKLEVENLDRQISQKQEEAKRIEGVINELQRRVAAVPTRESELIELTRDHGTMLELYTSLRAKKENARMAMNMEQRQIGEQFRILDPPRVPERPSSPDRPQLYGMGVIGGLALGLALLVLAEYRDHSVRTEADVVAVLALPVIAMVPKMKSSAERKRQRRKRVLLTASAAMSLVTGGAVLLWVLR
jgi:polysaccharide chain length determinant protein (PEP-CTERM system associated)